MAKQSQNPNLVQAEFFNLQMEAETLKKVLEECVDRFSDGAPIKTTVRCYDIDSVMSAFVEDYVSRKNQMEKLQDKILSCNGKQRFGQWRYRRLLKQQIFAKKIIASISTTLLHTALTHNQPIATENPDRTFRPIRMDETHELFERISVSRHAWVFLYEHEEICADSLNGIGAVM